MKEKDRSNEAHTVICVDGSVDHAPTVDESILFSSEELPYRFTNLKMKCEEQDKKENFIARSELVKDLIAEWERNEKHENEKNGSRSAVSPLLITGGSTVPSMSKNDVSIKVIGHRIGQGEREYQVQYQGAGPTW